MGNKPRSPSVAVEMELIRPRDRQLNRAAGWLRFDIHLRRERMYHYVSKTISLSGSSRTSYE